MRTIVMKFARNGAILLFFSAFFFVLLRAEKAVGPDFLLIQPHARTAAMGNAFTGLADDSNAVLFNPAGMPLIKKPMLSFTHFSSFGDTNFEYTAYAYPGGDWGAGGSVLYDYTTGFSNIDKTGQDIGDTHNYDLAFTGTFGCVILPGITAGISAKYFRSELLNYSKNGYAFDFGIMFRLMEQPDTHLGCALLNSGSQTAYEKQSTALPLTAKTGISVKYAFNESAGITAAFDIGRIIVNDDLLDISGGIEVCLYRIYFISAGFGFKMDGDTFSLGAGFKPVETLRISYAFQPFEYFGATHRISLDVFM
jgi:hypothetical protein